MRDLTKGNPAKLIIMFTIPVLIGSLFQQMYALVDSVIVGKTIGPHALAAVGSTGALSFLILGFVFGMTGGFSVITAQYFGRGDEDGVRRSVAMAIMLSVVVSAIVTVASVLVLRNFLELMRTPDDIIDDAYRYIVVIFLGIGGGVFYNFLASTLRAIGDSKTPLYFLIVASIANIFLDFVFILAFNLGTMGAGIATVISQIFSGFLCLIYVKKRFPILKITRKDFVLDGKFAWEHLKIGLPMAFQFSIIAIGIMILQTAVNDYGPDTVAAFTAANKIENFISQIFPAIGTTMATFAAQNYGVMNIKRIRQGLRQTTIMAMVISVIAVAMVQIFRVPFIKLFLPKNSLNEALIIADATVYINWISIFLPFLALIFIYRSALQGMSQGTITVIAGISELLFRTFAILVLSKFMAFSGVCLASPIAWVGAVIILLPYYFYFIKKLEKKCDKLEATQ